MFKIGPQMPGKVRTTKIHKHNQHTMSQSLHTEPGLGPTPLGLFAKLPQEIRDIIYEPLLSAGHTSITRASKALCQDTKAALSQYGIFRVQIAHDDQLAHDGRNLIFRFALHPRLRNAHLNDVRNIDLSFKPSRLGEPFPGADWSEGKLTDLVHGLVSAIGDPRRCNFRLDMSAYDFIFRQDDMAAFSLLREFKDTSVEVCLLRISYCRILSDFLMS